MDIQKIDEFISMLQSEVSMINRKLSSEKDAKITKAMLRQVNLINSLQSKVVEMKTSMSVYR